MKWANVLKVLKRNSLNLNTTSHNITSWYTGIDGSLEQSPNKWSLHYKEPTLQKIIPFWRGVSPHILSWNNWTRTKPYSKLSYIVFLPSIICSLQTSLTLFPTKTPPWNVSTPLYCGPLHVPPGGGGQTQPVLWVAAAWWAFPWPGSTLALCSGSASAPQPPVCLPYSSSVFAWSHRVVFLLKKISSIRTQSTTKLESQASTFINMLPYVFLSPIYPLLLCFIIYIHIYILVWF